MGYRWQVRVYPSRADGNIGWTSCRPNTRRNVVYWGNDRRNVPWIQVVFRYKCFQLHDPETMIECMMFKMIFYLTLHIIPWCGIKCDFMYLIGNVTYSLFSDTSWVEEFFFFPVGYVSVPRGKNPPTIASCIANVDQRTPLSSHRWGFYPIRSPVKVGWTQWVEPWFRLLRSRCW